MGDNGCVFSIVHDRNWHKCYQLLGKKYKSHHKCGGFTPSVSQYADIMALEMIEYEEILVESSSVCLSVEESCASLITTAMTSIVNGLHTQVLLNSKKQIRCILCNRVYLIERKMTMKCAERGYGFYKTTIGQDCWLYHVTMCGVPKAPAKGTKRYRVHK